MQTKKNSIKKLIIDAARCEFLEKGVKNTSIKDISSKSGVSVGNIYNYFKSKDDIFITVLAPSIKALKTFLDMELDEKFIDKKIFDEDLCIESTYKDFIDIMINYRKEIKLLIYESQGTPLEHFFEEYLELQQKNSKKYLELMKEKYPEINIDISELFLKGGGLMWMSIMKTLADEDNLSESDAKDFVKEYIKFVGGGWRCILGL